jgi:paraquat-inducible protein B
VTARGGVGTTANLDALIKQGMRAQLDTESLVTGLLYIGLDMHPNAPLNYVLEPDGPFQEIPTVPTDLEALQERLAKALDKFDQIDFNGLVVSITDASNSIKTLTGSPDLKATLASLKETVPNLNQTIISAKGLLINANSQIDPLIAKLRENSDQVNLTMKETRDALISVQQILDPDSPLTVHLNQTLNQLTDTTRSLGELTDYMERNPSSLIRGRYAPDEEK